ncbi:endocuticle structural glycoprotein SgAbd-2 [Lutzomyia longipalpis]|uniref:endocuticle structural glycoprotein SgAbd-2 n=1 Tax=Lutzomyia longipalpis TaxID=7200 RepID=UPI0024837F19|nr:endocuticle structural glycoprotein SgAbd-2 [Lutzomyia longipalpis]
MKVLIVFAVCLVALSAGERRFARQAAFGQPQPQAFQQQPQQPQRQLRQQQPQQQPQQPLAEERAHHAAPREYSQQPQQQQLVRQETTTWIPILKYNKEQGNDGSYKTQYETGNNIIAEETGFLRDFNENTPNGVLVQSGSYSYTAPDGQLVNVQYTADEGGFRATGDHIPTPPPIPEEIQKGLEQIYEGIRLQQEREAKEAKENPAEYAKKQEERARLNYHGQYYPN